MIFPNLDQEQETKRQSSCFTGVVPEKIEPLEDGRWGWPRLRHLDFQTSKLSGAVWLPSNVHPPAPLYTAGRSTPGLLGTASTVRLISLQGHWFHRAYLCLVRNTDLNIMGSLVPVPTVGCRAHLP